jgi:hypothetical protein
MSLLNKLPQGWPEKMATMYAVGASDVEIRADLKITTAMWDRLYDNIEESAFREVVDFGRMLSQAWWMTQGRINLDSRAFNANLWLMNMKNRFGWSEKTEIRETKDIQGMDTDRLDTYIRKALAKAGKSIKS